MRFIGPRDRHFSRLGQRILRFNRYWRAHSRGDHRAPAGDHRVERRGPRAITSSRVMLVNDVSLRADCIPAELAKGIAASARRQTGDRVLAGGGHPGRTWDRVARRQMLHHLPPAGSNTTASRSAAPMPARDMQFGFGELDRRHARAHPRPRRRRHRRDRAPFSNRESRFWSHSSRASPRSACHRKDRDRRAHHCRS